MDLDQIIRRNRARIALIVAVDLLNYAVVMTGVGWLAIWGLVYKINPDAQVEIGC